MSRLRTCWNTRQEVRVVTAKGVAAKAVAAKQMAIAKGVAKQMAMAKVAAKEMAMEVEALVMAMEAGHSSRRCAQPARMSQTTLARQIPLRTDLAMVLSRRPSHSTLSTRSRAPTGTDTKAPTLQHTFPRHTY